MTYDSSADLQPGTIVDGRYAIRRTIAHGSVAQVAEAEHVYTLRVVALKVPRGEGALLDAASSRISQETRALALARESGAVEILDAGVSSGAPYLVLELLRGRSLVGLLAARGKLSAGEAMTLLARAAETIGRCHAAGVVHRNLKPETLMVTPDPARQIVPIDFGDAFFVSDAEPAPSLRAQSFGSPGYRAPEADAGVSATDARLDVYALGATVHECLTGELPKSDASARTLTAVRADVPTAFLEIVARCLRPDPAERFANMDHVLEAVRTQIDFELDAVDLLRPPPPRTSARPLPTSAQSAPAQAGQQPAPQSATPGEDAEAASRRRQPRSSYAAPARLFTSRAVIDGRIEEVSESGVQFVCKQLAANIGESVRLRFALPISGRVAEIPGIVRWAKSRPNAHAMGMELVSHPIEVREELRRYVALVGAR